MIDNVSLPNSAMIDTGILIRALGGQPDHPASQACREFFEAMILGNHDILIAAPTLAEYLRFGKAESPPLHPHVIVAAFDERAVTFLGKHFPEATLHDWAKETEGPKPYFKYDAMIVACAKVYKVDCLVSLDGRRENGALRRMFTAAQSAGVTCRHPDDFQRRQLPIPGL